MADGDQGRAPNVPVVLRPEALHHLARIKGQEHVAIRILPDCGDRLAIGTEKGIGRVPSVTKLLQHGRNRGVDRDVAKEGKIMQLIATEPVGRRPDYPAGISAQPEQ